MAKKREASTLEPDDLPNLKEIKTIEFETFASFSRRHGDFVQVGDPHENMRDGSFTGTRLFFQDGATATGDDPFGTGKYDGRNPEDMRPLEVLRNRYTYVTTKLENEKYARAKFIDEVAQQARWHSQCPDSCPPPPANWKSQAARGRERIVALQDQGREILAELQAIDPELINRRKREERAQQHHERTSALVSEIESVR